MNSINQNVAWRGFKGVKWTDDVDVRDFIQNNYTPYDGDESFLAGPTEATNKLWGKVQELQKEERAKGGVLDCETEVVSSLTAYGPGYIDESMKDLEQARQKLRSNIDDKNSKLSVAAKDKPKAPALKPEQLKKGDAVRIVSMGLKGTVSSLPDAKGNLFVQCGIMRTSTNIKDLVRIEEATITTPTMSKTNTGKLRMSKSFSVSPEINLLGKTVDEALAALDKYLDDAYLAHLENVRVVHGKGTGALRKAIQQHLKRIKYVKSFRQGEYGEGDAGVTIVEFKK